MSQDYHIIVLTYHITTTHKRAVAKLEAIQTGCMQIMRFISDTHNVLSVEFILYTAHLDIAIVTLLLSLMKQLENSILLSIEMD